MLLNRNPRKLSATPTRTELYQQLVSLLEGLKEIKERVGAQATTPSSRASYCRQPLSTIVGNQRVGVQLSSRLPSEQQAQLLKAGRLVLTAHSAPIRKTLLAGFRIELSHSTRAIWHAER